MNTFVYSRRSESRVTATGEDNATIPYRASPHPYRDNRVHLTKHPTTAARNFPFPIVNLHLRNTSTQTPSTNRQNASRNFRHQERESTNLLFQFAEFVPDWKLISGLTVHRDCQTQGCFVYVYFLLRRLIRVGGSVRVEQEGNLLADRMDEELAVRERD